MWWWCSKWLSFWEQRLGALGRSWGVCLALLDCRRAIISDNTTPSTVPCSSVIMLVLVKPARLIISRLSFGFASDLSNSNQNIQKQSNNIRQHHSQLALPLVCHQSVFAEKSYPTTQTLLWSLIHKFGHHSSVNAPFSTLGLLPKVICAWKLV